ncbi:MAG: dihydrofolate reductase [Pseudomonadota bacterium]
MTAAKIALVVARAQNGVIGRGGALPWRMKSDLRWFKANTLGKPVVMGRKTFQSIGRALPGRSNIVITRQEGFTAQGVQAVRSLDDALHLAQKEALASEVDEVAIIGGGEIYKLSLPLADVLYLTTIEYDVEGDTDFPLLDEADWAIEQAGHIAKDADNDHDARLEIWRRPSST